MKVYLCLKLDHYSQHLIDHFMDYYNNLGVSGFAFIFSYFHKDLQSGFDEFVDKTTSKWNINYENYEHLPSDNLATEYLKKLSKGIDCDYIIPADSDEFHEYPYSLQDTIKYMEENNLDYIEGSTVERISENGNVIPIQKDISLFDQFPKNNPKLFSMPKISLMKHDAYQLSGCGHHYIDKKYNLKNERITKTHHFRWSTQSKKVVENWLKIYENEDFTGWRNAELVKKRLLAFDTNLINYDSN